MRLTFTTRKTWFGAVLSAVAAVSVTAQAEDGVEQPAAQVETATQSPDQVFNRSVSFITTLDAAACGAAGTSATSGACGASAGCCGDDAFGSLLGDKPLLGDLRGMSLGDCVTASIGGEVRYRFMNENDRLRPGGPGRSTYDLWRITPFMELNYGDSITGYVQAIDASIFNEELNITSIDRNRADLLQYYVDAALGDVGCGKLRARVGRQVLKYGSQHLVSPLAWSNTFRNFEGVKLYYTSDDWNIDGFWTRPVNGASGNVFRPTSFDHPDASRQFNGIYSTYKGMQNAVVDLYWLQLDEDNDKGNRIDGDRHTFGARYERKDVTKDACGNVVGTMTFELEGAFQVGDHETLLTAADEDIAAGMIHTNLGYTWNQAPWTPSIKGIFYWGSGDDDPGDGTNNNFNTLFPLGHAYWGIIDNLNGSNLFDYSLQASAKPCSKLTLVSALHWFEKDEAATPIFNVAGAPFPAGATTTGDTDIGTELDMIATYAHSKTLNVQVGYSWFWYGDAVDAEAAIPTRGDATQLYVMTTWSF